MCMGLARGPEALSLPAGCDMLPEVRCQAAGQPAEDLVVNKLCNRWIIAAKWALAVLANLHNTEIHRKRIKQQHAAGQRIANIKDHLDHFRSLDRANNSGQRTQNSSLRAAWNLTWWRRLWEDTPVASLAGNVR